MRLKSVCINEKEQIFLDGIEVNNVTDYKLENSAGSNEPAISFNACKDSEPTDLAITLVLFHVVSERISAKN